MEITSVNIDQMKTSAIEASELLKTMAHPERLIVLCQLINGEVGVGQLQQSSTLSQSAFSQHLTVLRKQGMIKARKESQQVFYSLSDLRVAQLVQSLQTIFCN
ncbi:transcriptional regulator [Vibrio qinghaiensis]|jgi:DNA-binding transcriptional ArsR family regulator|uniref:Transcriptional regulator n=1 Tax=Vibrio qinghaiensis TaxID=2025808 RepID=A0A223N2C5_9VIBR|nr:metalloregulator ArsR/SmtB family transcription factor [Vibrio qinghaiensis]ASU23947.1 transcriptional regulator [Vibrio qinghaiensis]